MRAYVQIVRSFNPAIMRYLLATALLGFSIDGGVYAVIFNLYLLRLGFGPESIGQINFVGLITFAICSLPAGALGARYGFRTLMLAGALLLALGSWLMPLVEVVTPGLLSIGILISYALLFLGLALYFANAAPYLMDIAAPGDLNHIFSMQSALLALAAFIGSMVGGYLPRIYANLTGISQDTSDPYRFPLYVAAIFMTMSAWAVMGTPKSATERSEELSETESQPVANRWSHVTLPILILIGVLSLIRFFQVAGIGTVATFFNVYLDAGLHESTARIGVLSALARITAVPAALITPFLISRWGAPRAVVIASAACSLFMLPLAIFPTWQSAGLGYVGVIAFSSLRYPAFLAYSLAMVPTRWRGMLSGAGETAGGFSFALMALIGGYLITTQGYVVLFLVSALLTALGTSLFWYYFRREIARSGIERTAQSAP